MSDKILNVTHTISCYTSFESWAIELFKDGFVFSVALPSDKLQPFKIPSNFKTAISPRPLVLQYHTRYHLKAESFLYKMVLMGSDPLSSILSELLSPKENMVFWPLAFRPCFATDDDHGLVLYAHQISCRSDECLIGFCP